MFDDEGIFLPYRLLIERILFVDVVELMKEIFITATREAKKIVKGNIKLDVNLV